MAKLAPFFTYYGGKNRAARHYPEPVYDAIVEPFAGSAGYSLNYPDASVLLVDTDPVVVGTWRYLLSATPDDILALPDLAVGQDVRDLELSQGAEWLVGWWLNKGTTSPCRTFSAWAKQYPRQFWGPFIRERIASQIEAVKHWAVFEGSYCATVPEDLEATWFIDPPYQQAGRRYRHGSAGIDYAALADWCKARQGQVIVCEADDADWLPFRPLAPMKGTEGRQKVNRAKMEVIWP